MLGGFITSGANEGKMTAVMKRDAESVGIGLWRSHGNSLSSIGAT